VSKFRALFLILGLWAGFILSGFVCGAEPDKKDDKVQEVVDKKKIRKERNRRRLKIVTKVLEKVVKKIIKRKLVKVLNQVISRFEVKSFPFEGEGASFDYIEFFDCMKILVGECCKNDKLKYFSKEEQAYWMRFLEIEDEGEKSAFVFNLTSSRNSLEHFFDKMFSVLFFCIPEDMEAGLDKSDEDA